MSSVRTLRLPAVVSSKSNTTPWRYSLLSDALYLPVSFSAALYMMANCWPPPSCAALLSTSSFASSPGGRIVLSMDRSAFICASLKNAPNPLALKFALATGSENMRKGRRSIAEPVGDSTLLSASCMAAARFFLDSLS